jgi:hypothetical protein
MVIHARFNKGAMDKKHNGKVIESKGKSPGSSFSVVMQYTTYLPNQSIVRITSTSHISHLYVVSLFTALSHGLDSLRFSSARHRSVHHWSLLPSPRISSPVCVATIV